MILENLEKGAVFTIYVDQLFRLSNKRYMSSISESDTDSLLNINDFKVNNRSDVGNILSNIDNCVNTLLKSCVLSVTNKYQSFIYEDIRISGKNGIDPEDNNLISYSCYFDFVLTDKISNASGDLEKYIKYPTIRFSTHMNEKQMRNLFAKSTKKKFFNVEIPPVTVSKLSICVKNIMESYFDFIDSLEKQNVIYSSVDELPSNLRKIIDSYNIQKI